MFTRFFKRAVKIIDSAPTTAQWATVFVQRVTPHHPAALTVRAGDLMVADHASLPEKTQPPEVVHFRRLLFISMGFRRYKEGNDGSVHILIIA